MGIRFFILNLQIGQTRNVTIYRLISEKTIEENILTKSMQKRRLGEMAIDEGEFTPQFFKNSNNLRALFSNEEAVADIIVPVVDDPKNVDDVETVSGTDTAINIFPLDLDTTHQCLE